MTCFVARKIFYSAKKIVLLVAVASISITFLTSCSNDVQKNPDALHTGMTLDEYTAIVPKDERFDWLFHSFFTSPDGKNVIVTLDSKFEVKTVETFDATVLNAKSFEKIEAGMTVSQVVELIGLPHEMATSMISLDFMSEDGQEYRVYFDTSYLVTSTSVFGKE